MTAAPYRLRTIRLVNWHNFVDETIPLTGSLFLVGDNGSGKTTLLDAVHVALTGNLHVELNAAARVGGRRHEGRDLAGIVLRHQLETGFGRGDGAVAYAALELAREDGAVLTVGVGAFVAGPEARPELWGFLTPRPVGEVPLVTPANGGKRATDRAELAAALKPGEVVDIGRYRTQVAQRLFRDRERFEEIAAFLQAGKAYRELVAKTGVFSELFATLLAAPDAAAYQEVRRALEAIGRIRSDLGALEDELASLRELLAWLSEVERGREAIARYAYVEARFAREDARAHERKASGEEAAAQAALDAADAELSRASGRVQALQVQLGRLRASQGADRLGRHQELKADVAAAGQELADRTDHAQRAARAAGEASEAAGRARAAVAKAASSARAVLEHVRRGCASDVDVATLESLGRLDQLLERAGGGGGWEPVEAERLERALRSSLTARAAVAREAVLEAAREREVARRRAAELEREAGELRARGELEPPLPGLEGALRLLAADGIPATPLYRLLEPAGGVDLARAGQLERALGPRVLGTLVVAEGLHGRARELLLRDAPGVPLADPAQLAARESPALPAGSAAGLLQVAEGSAIGAALVARLLGGVELEPGAAQFLTSGGHLHAAGADERLLPGPPRWLGAAARAHALELRLAELASQAAAERERAEAAGARSEREDGLAKRLEALVRELDGLGLASLSGVVRDRDEAARREEDLRAASASAEAARRERADRAAALTHALDALEEALRAEGLLELSERIAACQAELDLAHEAVNAASGARGRREAQRQEAARALGEASRVAGEAQAALDRARGALLARVPAEARADLDHYVDRVKAGHQLRRANLARNREEAQAQIARLQERIALGVRHPHLWQKYAFRHDEAENRIAAAGGADLEDVTAKVQAEVDELTSALRGRNEELLERVVLEDLVGTLRREVFGLQATIKDVNAKIADLSFGGVRYRIDARLRDEFRRAHELLRTASGLGRAAREELKSYFESRLDQLADAGDEELPALLDYRRWFQFDIRMSQAAAEGVALSRERLRLGSGGEQAVPNYLLLFCLTALLYDRVDAKVRLLLLDEAFYGVDAGRREELLRFCTRAGLDLVVATPEMDGVTASMLASTTLLVEKSPGGDVFLSPFHYQQKRATLFEAATPDPANLVIDPRLALGGAAIAAVPAVPAVPAVVAGDGLSAEAGSLPAKAGPGAAGAATDGSAAPAARRAVPEASGGG